MSFKHFIELSYQLAIADFKTRNEGTYLGIAWYLLSPLLLFLSLWLIFFDRIGQEIPEYPGYLFIGIILFSFFQNITTSSIRLLRDHFQLINSINFNKATLVLSTVINHLFSHFFEIILVMIVFLIFGISPLGFIFYPLILLLFAAFIYGFSLILTVIGTYFRDLDNIWVFISRLLWFVTPIFYSFEGQTRLYLLNQFNPAYHFINITRELILYNNLAWNSIIIASIFTIIVLAIGIPLFNKNKYRFAELV